MKRDIENTKIMTQPYLTWSKIGKLACSMPKLAVALSLLLVAAKPRPHKDSNPLAYTGVLSQFENMLFPFTSKFPFTALKFPLN